MNILLEAGHAGGRTPLAALTTASLPGWLDTQPETTRRWIDSMGFSAQPGSWCGVPGTLAPCGTTVPGTTGPSSLVHAG